MKKRASRKFKRQLPKRKVLYKRPRKEEEEKKREFPRISRIIPDISVPSLRRVFWNKYFLVSFISTFISVAILMQGIDLTKHIRELQGIRSEREQVVREITYWEDVVSKHQDYRDGYLKLALLEYRLGNTQKAKAYIEKSLSIDPNHKPALDFRRKLEEN